MLPAIILVLPEFGWCEWQTFSKSSGLADNYVSSMLEDHLGNLWFGTVGRGVSRFDGVTWRMWTTAEGLAGNAVSSMLEDHSGNLWFGTVGHGIGRFDGVGWRIYTDLLTNSNDIYSILEDRSGNLWFGTDRGVARFDGVNWRTYGTSDGLTGYAVFSMLEDRAGNLWFGTDICVNRFDGMSWRTYGTSDGLANSIVISMLEDHSGNLWFGTQDGGVNRFDGVSWRPYTTSDGLAGNAVRSMLQDRSGNIWFGTEDGGVSQFDGVTWRTYSTTDGLAGNAVRSMLQDRSGNLWFATYGSGVSRFDGVSWKSYSIADGLAGNTVISMLQDRSRRYWFGTQGSGVSRFDGASWKTYTTFDGLAGNAVHSMLEDRSGRLWLGTDGGVSLFDGGWSTPLYYDVHSILEDRAGNLWFGTNGLLRFDGVSWRTYTTADGLPDNLVLSMLEDRSGNLWVGTARGVGRFDGAGWTTYTDLVIAPSSMLEDHSGNLWFGQFGVIQFDGVSQRTFRTADGMAGDLVSSILEDRSGNVWFGTDGGVSRFDGVSWRTYTTADGLATNKVYTMLEDRAGNLWFGTDRGVSRLEPDRVPPKTVFLNVPAPVSGARNLSATFIAAFGEANGIEFSSRLDSGSWSAWAPVGAWTEGGLTDGPHALEARSRDYAGNVDLFPALVAFVVDATPPAPSLSSPAFGQAVQGSTTIRGTTADARFFADSVWVRPAGTNSWVPPAAILLAHSSTQVTDGDLANWNTSNLRDGLYDLRVSVTDSVGLTGSALVSVVVDNHFPYAGETSPAKVTAASGGDLYTTNQELHLYFPPHAFDQDALVSIAAAGSPPDTLPSGAIQVLPSYDIAWSTIPLRKPATLEFSTAGMAPVPGSLAVYESPDGASWHRLGGTPEEGKVSLAVQQAGQYALFAETTIPAGEAALSALTFTPRVFSPTGAFANDHVAIGFSLGRSAPVTVRIYNRAGRLVSEVVSGRTMGAGANIIRWDGRERGGLYVADGIYLVTVEALGQTRRNTLAIVR